MNIGQVYESNNFGALKIIDCRSSKNVEVQFVETGYKTTTQAGNIYRGTVKDYLSPSVHGVGFIGEGDHKRKVNGKVTQTYIIWKAMLSRCYCLKTQSRRPSYKGCSVVPEWHDFQVFAEWFELNHITGCDIDKDIKINGNKVYGPDTCLFVTRTENIVEAHAGNFEFISPSGVLTNIYNLNEFCRNNGLAGSAMSNVHLGKRKHHKGWTKYVQAQ